MGVSFTSSVPYCNFDRPPSTQTLAEVFAAPGNELYLLYCVDFRRVTKARPFSRQLFVSNAIASCGYPMESYMTANLARE